jgi:PAS domain S-box-containing protein
MAIEIPSVTPAPLPAYLKRTLPWLAAASVVVLSAVLVVTIFLTERSLVSVAFLSGVLTAASLALASRHSSIAWELRRARAVAEDLQRKLQAEAFQRQRTEKLLLAGQPVEHYLNEIMPAMMAYIDADRRIVFHNHAYQRWLGIPASRIEGHTLPEVFGAQIYAEMKGYLDQAFNGQLVRYERAQRMPGGLVSRLAVLCLPHFGEQSVVQGVFAVLVDVTGRDDLAAAVPAMPAGAGAAQGVFAEALAKETLPWPDVEHRLVAALQNDEFLLFSQKIAPLSEQPGAGAFREILLRLQEEEENLMPPGAFLPIAEQHGLMPDLDEWVVRHLFEWIASDPSRGEGLYSVNVSGASICDPHFCDFVGGMLDARKGKQPGLCLEFDEGDALLDLSATLDFIRQLRPKGCRFALSGFSGDPMSFKLLKGLKTDYLKIDGGLVVGMARNPLDASKVKAIACAARTMGVLTIAQCVEDVRAIDQLREFGVDFAQGFAIARPAPLVEALATV